MSKEPVIKAEKFGLTMCGKFNQIERRIKSKTVKYFTVFIHINKV